MTDHTTPEAGPSAPPVDVYSPRNLPGLEADLALRTASANAAFFLPHLRPGMALLDCGCGPGAITLGLAEVVAPGEVVGIDLQPHLIEQARALASERGISNARFDVGSISALPFPDASFDAVFSHAVLMYLREPVRALAEMRRVLRPGGVIGLRSWDVGTTVFVPSTPLLDQMKDVMIRGLQADGGDPFVARHQRRLLLEAGFVRTEATAAAASAGSSAELRQQAPLIHAQFHGLARTAMEQGWVDQATVAAIDAELDAWTERPDAFRAAIICAAVGWVAA